MGTDKRLMETRQRMTGGRDTLIESDKKTAADECRNDREQQEGERKEAKADRCSL